MEPFGYGIIGIGGYGAVHLAAVEALEREGHVSLRAVAEAFPDSHQEKLDELRGRGVRIYGDYREMVCQEQGLQIVSVATPLHMHTPMALACFERGLHVMLEKPPAVLVQDVDRMLAAARKNGCACQVGFQNVADPAARELKAQVAAGALGLLSEMVVVGKGCRYDGYYERASWAGKLRVGEDWVLDGPLNNPLCHYIHQALLVACPRDNETLRPVAVQAELYRAHAIEGEDVVCARARLEGGVSLHTYLTLCARESHPVTVEITGERGKALWQPGRYEIRTDAGHTERSFEPQGEPLFRNLVGALRGEQALWSPLSATRNVILHNNGCFASAGTIRPIPPASVQRHPTPDGDVATFVDGLDELIDESAASRRMFSEMGVAWAAGTRQVTLDFERFDPSPLLGA